MKQKTFSAVIFIFLFAPYLRSQDIKGAYIQTKWIPYTNTFTPVYQYSVSVFLLVDANINVPRPTLTVTFTFGQTETYSLTNSVPMANSTLLKIYSGTHSFPGSNPEGSYYSVQYIDSFLIGGVKNISTSQNQPVCAESRLIANSFIGAKNSGTITNFPLELALSGENVTCSLGFVSTNDSTSYALVNYCNPSGYYIPNGAILSPTSGILTFSKDSFGLYSFNVRINEWCRDINSLMKVARTTFANFVIDVNGTVGIKEYNGQGVLLKLYPNPTSKFLNVEYSEAGDQNLDYNIYSVSGQKLSEVTLKPTSQKNIDVSNLPEGVYFINVSDGTRTFSNKFIKTND